MVLDKPLQQPHLENFFDAIRGTAKLNCPADEAWKTEVIMHKVNEALAAGKRVDFRPDDFACGDVAPPLLRAPANPIRLEGRR